jgi:hypothetical protein
MLSIFRRVCGIMGVDFSIADDVRQPDGLPLLMGSPQGSNQPQKPMKKTSTPESEITVDDDLLPEYDLVYSKGRPNRYAGQIDKSQVVVMLEPDIAEVFTTPESVNAVLRALIATMPATPAKSARKASSASAA